MRFYHLSLLLCLSSRAAVGREDVDEVFVSQEVMVEFKTKQGIKAGYDDLVLQAITAEKNTVTLPDGTVVSLDDMTPRSYFSESANCFYDGQPAACPEPTVMTKVDAETGLQVLASMDANGEIISLVIGQKGSGRDVTLVSVAPGVVTHIPFEAFDQEYYQNFEFGDPRTPRSHAEQSRHHIRKQDSVHVEENQEQEQQPASHDDRHDLAFCTDEVREVEVAVAVESTFCLQAGGQGFVEAVVNNIMANVANTYEVDGLCFTAKIVHYEQYCDKSDDPYQDAFENNSAGCGRDGVLQAFESYWNDNRQGVERDAAMLFAGRCLQFGLNGCSVIGCAYLGASCTGFGSSSYGVAQVGYSFNPAFRAYLVSHELGHVLGAEHNDLLPWEIMRSSGASPIRIFGQSSKDSFLDQRNDACITTSNSGDR